MDNLERNTQLNNNNFTPNNNEDYIKFAKLYLEKTVFDFELIGQIPVIIEQKYQKNNIVNIETKNNTIKEKIKEKQNIINKKDKQNTKINKQNKIR